MDTKQIVEDLESEATAMMDLAESLKRGGDSPLTSEDWNMIRRATMHRLQDAFSEIAFMYVAGMPSDNLAEHVHESLKYFTTIAGMSDISSHRRSKKKHK